MPPSFMGKSVSIKKDKRTVIPMKRRMGRGCAKMRVRSLRMG